MRKERFMAAMKWLPPSPKRASPAARAAMWAAQIKRPKSDFATAFEGRLINYKWNLTPPKERKPR
jgi:hypothetical protein